MGKYILEKKDKFKGERKCCRPSLALMMVGQGPTALAVGTGGGCWTFSLSSVFSLSGRRPDID